MEGLKRLLIVDDEVLIRKYLEKTSQKILYLYSVITLFG